jgi:hypothetical protein
MISSWKFGEWKQIRWKIKIHISLRLPYMIILYITLMEENACSSVHCTLYNFFNDTESTESTYLPTATYMSLVIFLGLLRTVGQSLLYATVRDGWLRYNVTVRDNTSLGNDIQVKNILLIDFIILYRKQKIIYML